LGLLTTTVSTVTFLQLDGDLLSELMMIELQPMSSSEQVSGEKKWGVRRKKELNIWRTTSFESAGNALPLLISPLHFASMTSHGLREETPLCVAIAVGHGRDLHTCNVQEIITTSIALDILLRLPSVAGLFACFNLVSFFDFAKVDYDHGSSSLVARMSASSWASGSILPMPRILPPFLLTCHDSPSSCSILLLLILLASDQILRAVACDSLKERPEAGVRNLFYQRIFSGREQNWDLSSHSPMSLSSSPLSYSMCSL
jgi:hypothetical protein